MRAHAICITHSALHSRLSKGFGFLHVPSSTLEKISGKDHVLEGRKIRVEAMTARD